MRFLQIIALFFALSYTALLVHYLGFDRTQKAQTISLSASKIKPAELSLSYRQKEYKAFVYAH